MLDRVSTLRRIMKLIESFPRQQLQDSSLSSVGQEWSEIASLYESIGDVDSAADWFLRGAGWSYEAGHILRAVALVRRALKLRPDFVEARELYKRLWALTGIGGIPDPIE